MVDEPTTDSQASSHLNAAPEGETALSCSLTPEAATAVICSVIMMDFSSGELDEAFAQHVIAIRAHAARLGSRHEKIRIQRWLTALSSPTQQLVWKKIRNQHSVCLAEMLARGKMEAPFTQMPTVPLQNFPAHLVARYSSLQGSLSSALLWASPPSHPQDAGASANAAGVARAQSRVASEVGPLSTPASRPAGASGAHRSRVDHREEFLAHDVPNPGTEHGETGGRVSAAEGTIMQPLSIHQIMKMTNAQLVARLVQEQVLFVSLFLVLQLSFYSARMPNSHRLCGQSWKHCVLHTSRLLLHEQTCWMPATEWHQQVVTRSSRRQELAGPPKGPVKSGVCLLVGANLRKGR